MRWVVLSLCLLVGGAVAAPPVRLPTPHQSMVVTVEATTATQVQILKDLQESDYEIDFWTHPRLGLTDVMVPWRRFNALKAHWTTAGMKVKVAQPDVEALIKTTAAEDARKASQYASARDGNTTLAHNVYRSYSQYLDGLRELRSRYGNLMRFDETGNSLPRNRSIENRIIHFVELGANLDKSPVIMLEVNIHAREWVTSAGGFYMIDRLLTRYGAGGDETRLLNNFHLVIIPVANPDGYEYSRQSSNTRLWRKNRRYVNIFCYGIDLNRNFNAFWQSGGGCSSDAYPGPAYNSEPETNAVESIFRRFQSQMVMYFPVHCYSQILLLPWSYQSTSNVVNSLHRDVGNAMANVLTGYKAGTAYSTISYAAAGTSGDWALVQKGANSGFVSIAYELRPAAGAGSGGFILPASEIVPNGRDLFHSLVAAANMVSRQNHQ